MYNPRWTVALGGAVVVDEGEFFIIRRAVKFLSIRKPVLRLAIRTSKASVQEGEITDEKQPAPGKAGFDSSIDRVA